MEKPVSSYAREYEAHYTWRTLLNILAFIRRNVRILAPPLLVYAGLLAWAGAVITLSATSAAVAMLVLYILWERHKAIRLENRLKTHMIKYPMAEDGEQVIRTSNTFMDSYRTMHEADGCNEYQLVLSSNDQVNVYDQVVGLLRANADNPGKYEYARMYHTVVEYKLSRIVPNVLFDNTRFHGRQFKYYFRGTQRLSFEGDFDHHFDSYAPQGYTVDAFSFISPEVLQAMKDVPGDIELRDDRLICIAPLMRSEDLASYEQSVNQLHRVLDDNIARYRDDHVLWADRASVVDPFGLVLLKSPFAYPSTIILAGISIAVFIYVSGKQGDVNGLLQEVSLFGIAFYGYSLIRMIRTWLKNRRKIRQFEAAQRYVASRNAEVFRDPYKPRKRL